MKNVRPAGRWCTTRATCMLERRWHSSKHATSVDRTTQRCRSFAVHQTFCGCICNGKCPICVIRRRFGFKISTIWSNAPVSFIEVLKSTIVIRNEDSSVKSIQRYVFSCLRFRNWILISQSRSRAGHHRSILVANRYYRNGCNQCLLFGDNSFVFVYFLLVLEVASSARATFATSKQHSSKFTQSEYDRSAGITATTQLCRIWFLSVLISIRFLFQFQFLEFLQYFFSFVFSYFIFVEFPYVFWYVKHAEHGTIEWHIDQIDHHDTRLQENDDKRFNWFDG